MEKAVIEKVRKSVAQKKDEIVKVEVLRGDKDAYITRTLESCEGNFILRSQRDNYYYFTCDRSRKSRGKSTGDPSCTTANSCRASCSIKFESHGLLEVCVVKIKPVHSGHEIGNPEHTKRNRLHPDLKTYLHLNFSEGRTNADALSAAAAWSIEREQLDRADRRYYPTPKDIKYLRHTYQKATQLMDADDDSEETCIVLHDTPLTVQEMLADLVAYASSEYYEPNPEVEDLLRELHAKIFVQKTATNADHNYPSKGQHIKGVKRKNVEVSASVVPEHCQVIEVSGVYRVFDASDQEVNIG